MNRQTLLIADNSAADRAALKAVLEDDFFVLELDQADKAPETAAEKANISLALIDISFDTETGLNVIKQMSNDAVLKCIPIIAITAANDENAQVAAIKSGAKDFICKPYKSDIIFRRVMNTIVYQRTTDEMDAASLQLHTLLNNLPGGVSIFEVSENKIENVYVNESLRIFTGYSHEEFKKLFSSNFAGLIAPADYPAVIAKLRKCILENCSGNMSFRLITKSGAPFWVNMRSTKIGTSNGHHLLYSILLDTNAEKALEQSNNEFLQKLGYQARHDQLTGIYNRRAFCEETAKLLNDNPSVNYALICTDIYRFKVINELFGVETGNNILKAIAQHLYQALEGVGTYCRLEADLFAFCLPEEMLDIESFLSNIQLAIASLKINYDIPIYAGIYKIDDKSVPIDIMCDRAALALNTIKGNYIKLYGFYDGALRTSIVSEQKIARSMSSALGKGEFCFYLQPICDITTNSIVSAEALVRWNHPSRGLLPPKEFLPLFERNGFITKLDAFIWEEVAKYIGQRQRNKLPTVPISVNVSRVNMHNPHLCRQLLDITRKYNIDSSMIKFEITESAYNDNPRQLIETMKQLQSHGFQMLMDDFGSGYSSLNMLKDVPVNVLKIDMRFIDDLEKSNRAGNVVTSVVRMAKWLDMQVVAEGVETKAQLDFLRSIGCDQAQGYYFAAPMPTSQFEQYLSDSSSFIAPKGNSTISPSNLDALLNSSREINLLFNSVIGAIGIYELSENNIEVVRVNDGYYTMMGLTPQTLFTGGRNILSHIFPEDCQSLLSHCRLAENTGKVQQTLLRRYITSGKMIWLDLKIRYIGQNKGNSLFYFACNDVTQQKSTEQKEYLQKYSAALRSLYSQIYEYNYTADTMRIINLKNDSNSAEPEVYPLHATVEETIKKICHPRDASICLWSLDCETVKRKVAASKNDCYTFEVRIKHGDGKYHWISKTFIRVPDDNEDIYLCCIADID